jgi:hypothetical protein
LCVVTAPPPVFVDRCFCRDISASPRRLRGGSTDFGIALARFVGRIILPFPVHFDLSRNASAHRQAPRRCGVVLTCSLVEDPSSLSTRSGRSVSPIAAWTTDEGLDAEVCGYMQREEVGVDVVFTSHVSWTTCHAQPETRGISCQALCALACTHCIRVAPPTAQIYRPNLVLPILPSHFISFGDLAES